ncbi:MAG: 2Fe-2S iron-sulfur cluster binding domain-containing protein [Acidobacteriia bacterium]|nr:2Fe-2S iron-sulfur cluster binding domain-containing protein [Terriglobia bacterium]
MTMNPQSEPLFDAFLNQHDEEAWFEVVSALLPSIHPVDKTATQIWFRFFPLSLHRALDQAENPGELAKRLLLAGRYELKDQIDSSHAFFYGHRYWPQVKKAVEGFAEDSRPPESLELAAQIIDVAREVSLHLKVHESFLIGITAVAFMTLQQVGMDAFRAAPGAVETRTRFLKRKPEQILKTRSRDDSQGLFGFLRGEAKQYTVTFNENKKDARFKLISTQQITTAAANDKRDYRSSDPRCVPEEGPIPVECRAATCGSCWVGILAGAEKLSEVGPRESKQIKEFGYIDSSGPKPLIRLACQAHAYGALSIVIPPWNGVFGKYLRAQKRDTPDTQEASNR